MKIFASSLKNKVILTIEDNYSFTKFRLERKSQKEDEWKVYTTSNRFIPISDINEEEFPAIIKPGDFLDNHDLLSGLYEYRIAKYDEIVNVKYSYTPYVRIGNSGGIGYSFKNYTAPTGTWGMIVTPDDIRYTYLWGTDLKATNGQSYTDEQIEYFIESATESIGRTLDIDIKKTRYRTNPQDNNLVKNQDYDREESLYDFKYSRIQKYGLIKTRHKPIINVVNLEMLSRFSNTCDLTNKIILDKNKGIIKLLERPLKPSPAMDGVSTAINMYGSATFQNRLFYKIDYDAGYETSDDVPSDLREIIAKQCAVSMLNVIGDGLMSGFSSSSLSMDGVSESFSSTQSATSAYFGARIAEYKKDIDTYLKENRNRFNNMAIGCL